jgi:hypothetical protein
MFKLHECCTLCLDCIRHDAGCVSPQSTCSLQLELQYWSTLVPGTCNGCKCGCNSASVTDTVTVTLTVTTTVIVTVTVTVTTVVVVLVLPVLLVPVHYTVHTSSYPYLLYCTSTSSPVLISVPIPVLEPVLLPCDIQLSLVTYITPVPVLASTSTKHYYYY